MLTDWLKMAERIAIALERMADAAEANLRQQGKNLYHSSGDTFLASLESRIKTEVTDGHQGNG